ncbi:MAG TPA: glycosyltransferase family 87 protein [Candidatus Dormibacteraeota bacterium]|nr:glycosyltransferase family 87 protein [Candidatus Dormibacteraeota bacterium]
MTASPRWRNLGTASGAVPAVLFAGYDLYQWLQAYLSDHFHNDFTFYDMAARLGLNHGWRSLYDLSLQQAGLDALSSRIKVAELARYISPPPLAWLAIPFTPLPYEVAYWLWSAMLLAALAGCWYLAAPGAGRARVIFLAAAVGWLPVIYGLQLGQPGLLVALGVAGCYALLRAGRDFWAGVALGVLALKPQLAFLVPPALIVARRDRAFAGSVVALGGLAVASVVALGPGGVSDYLDRLSFASSVPVNRELTLAALAGSVAVARAVEVVIALWSLALVYRLGRRSVEWIFVPALLGGVLAAPYLHLDDLVMVGLAGWLYLRTPGRPAWTWAYALAIVLAAEGLPIWGPAPLILLELGGLVLISVAAARPTRAALTLPQIDARPLELRQRP